MPDGLSPADESAARDAHSARASRGWRERLVDWLRRYGVAECAGVSCALAGSFAVRHLTGSKVATAYAGAWGESIGYGGTIILRDYLAMVRAAHAVGRAADIRDAGEVATGLVTEFGPAAILDTLVTRPFAMGMGMRLLGPVRGLIAGKLAADVLFYLPVIIMYERRKHRANARPEGSGVDRR